MRSSGLAIDAGLGRRVGSSRVGDRFCRLVPASLSSPDSDRLRHNRARPEPGRHIHIHAYRRCGRSRWKSERHNSNDDRPFARQEDVRRSIHQRGLQGSDRPAHRRGFWLGLGQPPHWGTLWRRRGYGQWRNQQTHARAVGRHADAHRRRATACCAERAVGEPQPPPFPLPVPASPPPVVVVMPPPSAKGPPRPDLASWAGSLDVGPHDAPAKPRGGCACG
jgi:hypothetical protein